MRSLNELAEDAEDAVSDLMDDEGFLWFQSLPDVEKIQWRYCHADCDDFAEILSDITGWPIVAINAPALGPLHRLVESPDGQLLDARGWTTEEALKKRYKARALSLHRGEFVCETLQSPTDDDLPVVDVILQLPIAPFNEMNFLARTNRFRQKCISERDVPARQNQVSDLEMSL